MRRVNPVGLDVVIDRIQNALDLIGWDNYENYPRAYRNLRDSKTIPEVHIGGNEYQEVFTDDTYSATSFFLDSESVEYVNGMAITDISIYFQVDLYKLYPSEVDRADEKAHQDALSVLKEYEVTGIVKGIKRVYSELYNTDVQDDDLQPYHVFRIDLKVSYLDSCLC